MKRALCKFHGMLVIAEFSVPSEGSQGSCPECGCTEFREVAGWIECYGCCFAILASDYTRIMEASC